MQQVRGKQGRFVHKSDADRQVRSIRATDSTWQTFGQYANELGMTRADLLEHLVLQWQQQRSSSQAVDPEPEKPTSIADPARAKPSARYYLQLSYRTKHRREEWYWDGSELVPKGFSHPSVRAKVYSSKSAAIGAAKKLQKHIDLFADRVKQPADLLSLKPVRVTW